MPHEHFNDMPGDITGSEAENLPGGFGGDDPDADLDATIDELIDNDVRAPGGETFVALDQQDGLTTGTGYVELSGEGESMPMADLLEGEEGHPGAAVGFTGAEPEKRSRPSSPRRRSDLFLGGRSSTPETAQQERNVSAETESPARPHKRKAA